MRATSLDLGPQAEPLAEGAPGAESRHQGGHDHGVDQLGQELPLATVAEINANIQGVGLREGGCTEMGFTLGGIAELKDRDSAPDAASTRQPEPQAVASWLLLPSARRRPGG